MHPPMSPQTLHFLPIIVYNHPTLSYSISPQVISVCALGWVEADKWR